MLSEDAGAGIDGRFPKASRGTRWFLYWYPCAAILGTAESSKLPYGVVFIGILFGLAWLAYLANAAIIELQRRGYEAAMEDFALMKLAERALEGRLPGNLQATFDAEMSKRS
jgi:hypothetical protein